MKDFFTVVRYQGDPLAARGSAHLHKITVYPLKDGNVLHLEEEVAADDLRHHDLILCEPHPQKVVDVLFCCELEKGGRLHFYKYVEDKDCEERAKTFAMR